MAAKGLWASQGPVRQVSNPTTLVLWSPHVQGTGHRMRERIFEMEVSRTCPYPQDILG